MNILVFTNSFYPSIGGLENQTLILGYEFLRHKHKVEVITLQFSEIILVSEGPLLKDMNINYRPGFLKKMRLFLWADVIYMPNISLKGIWFFFLRPFKKWVISHNDFYLSDTKNMKVRLKRFLIQFATHNIAVSKSVANYINPAFKTIYNCYDNGIFKIYKEETRVNDFVFLGRLTAQKGCDLLIKACKNLDQPFTLNIIGDGNERPSLEKLVSDLELQQSIKFLGLLQDEELARTLNRHKIMVIPSVEEEGFGMVVLEGMACGCKIIAADAGGLSEAVNGFGKTFKMADQEALEALLKEAITNTRQDTSALINENLNNYLSTHKKETVAQKYLDLFQ